MATRTTTFVQLSVYIYQCGARKWDGRTSANNTASDESLKQHEISKYNQTNDSAWHAYQIKAFTDYVILCYIVLKQFVIKSIANISGRHGYRWVCLGVSASIGFMSEGIIYPNQQDMRPAHSNHKTINQLNGQRPYGAYYLIVIERMSMYCRHYLFVIVTPVQLHA